MQKRVIELFAGVGGFRLGLGDDFETVWFSQWEPGKKRQDAYECYVSHFGDCDDPTTNIDINKVNKENIPDADVLTAGFPCQDYSVANTKGEGIAGKKGVLWWDIEETLAVKRPAFILLENVDRLLKSPTSQRGRDFGIILTCLNELGYSAEWRVINSADYGSPQRRRRVFIFVYRNDTKYAYERQNLFMAQAFPYSSVGEVFETALPKANIKLCSDTFSFDFKNAGVMTIGGILTADVVPAPIDNPMVLGDVVYPVSDSKYYLTDAQKERFTYLKGAKKVERISTDGFKYVFSEGATPLPDSLDKPGRTLLTSEKTLSRPTHVIADPESGKLRFLTPIEAERLQGFPDGWTDTGMSERMRYFCMGNALVVPMVARMGKVLNEIIDKEN